MRGLIRSRSLHRRLLHRFSSWLADRRFDAWKRRNPGKHFSQFYVDDVHRRFAGKRGHPTLGAQGLRSSKSVKWDRSSFAARGKNQWRFYAKATDFDPQRRYVDFGCGSVRLGQHAISELDRGNYWGLDVSDAFYSVGLELIDPQIVQAKSPRFSVIDDETLSAVEAWRPDVIFSNAVLQHVPPTELKTFFQRIGRIMLPGAVAAIVFMGDAAVGRVKAMSWAYPDDVLQDAVLDADDELEVEFVTIEGEDAEAFGGRRRLLRLRRAEA